MGDKEPKLTPRQLRFVEEYLVDLNAKNAAIRAGSEAKRADQQGYEYLSKPEIASEIERRMKERSQISNITAQRVLQEIARMAFYDPAEFLIEVDKDADDGDFFDPMKVTITEKEITGLRGPADIKRLPEDVRRAITGWGWDKNQNFTVKLADKSKALDQLARHLSLYNDKLEVSGVDALADRLARARKRGDD